MKKNVPYGGRAERKKSKPGSGTAGKLTLAIVTCLNLGLGVALSVLNRREIIHAVQEDEDVKVLLTTKGKTEEK